MTFEKNPFEHYTAEDAILVIKNIRSYKKTKNGSKRRVKSRSKLYDKDPHCYHCGILTEPFIIYRTDSTCTADHIYSRFDIKRYEPENSNLIQLSCYKCNHSRGKFEEECFKERCKELFNIPDSNTRSKENKIIFDYINEDNIKYIQYNQSISGIDLSSIENELFSIA